MTAFPTRSIRARQASSNTRGFSPSRRERVRDASGSPAARLVDNRPDAIAQRKRQEMADRSPQVQRLAGLQAMANRGPRRPEHKAGMPDGLKAGIEHLSGMSMDDVNVHYNSARPAQLRAFAYTQGTDIHVAPGQEQHLAHEAWHVVQQKQGRVTPTLQARGVSINDDSALEREADVMGSRASRMSRFRPAAAGPVAPALSGVATPAPSQPIVQGAFYEKTYAGAVTYRDGDAGDDMVYSGATHDDEEHGELRVYYKKAEWMQKLLDETLTEDDTYIEGTAEGNEDRACFNWALFGFDDTSDDLVWPAHVYNYFKQPHDNHTNQWITANVPADKGRQWMLDNKDDLDAIITSWAGYEYSEDLDSTENDLGASTAIFKMIIEANGFTISDDPTPYEIGMHYTTTDGVTFEHVWLRVNGHVIETFPYTAEQTDELGNVTREGGGIKDIGLGGGEQSHDGMSVMRFYVTSLKTVQVDHILRALNDAAE